MIKILVPIDYSDCSLAALKHAEALARAANGTLLIIHVETPPPIEPPFFNTPNPLEREFEARLEEMSKAEKPVAFESRRIVGLPASVIVTTATEEKVDLIVMGTTGRSGLKRLVLGSVTDAVIRRATCPVLTLRSSGEEPRLHEERSGGVNWTRPAVTPVVPLGPTELVRTEVDDNPTLALITRAINARASDVHIDPLGDEFRIRFRVDGKLSTYCMLSHEVGHSLMTQLKLTANLNIADPHHSQEGRLQLPVAMYGYEVRITTVRTVEGEAISLRVLSRSRLMRPIDELGLSAESQERIERILHRGEGLVLVTGPTGSGKTTTLYSMLRTIDDGAKNIVSIEDPVEFSIPTFRQVSVDCRHGATMTTGLRTLLRLDPDVILVGEIRDVEAAETAMRAASSGKYVFSSLHTRDVASTITALRDLRIDNRSLAGNLVGIVSQRLLRRLCLKCHRAATPTENEQSLYRDCGLSVPAEIRHPVGCPACHQTGYFDRIGIFEVVTPDREIAQAIATGVSEEELRVIIRTHGVSTLETEGLKLAAAGITSLEECTSMNAINPRSQAGSV